MPELSKNITGPTWVVKDLHTQTLGSLRLGEEDLSRLPSDDLERLKAVYANALNSPAGRAALERAADSKSTFSFRFSPKSGLFIEAGGVRERIAAPQEILEKGSPFLRALHTAHASAERKGLGVPGEGLERCGKAFLEADQERRAESLRAAPKSLAERVLKKLPEKIAICNDSLSFVRNTFSAAISDPNTPVILFGGSLKAADAVGRMALGGSVLSMASGGFIMRDSYREGKKAHAHGDAEGGALAGANGYIGANLSFLGAATMTYNVAAMTGSTGASAAAAAAGVSAITGSGFALYGAIGIVGAAGAAIAGRFRAKMNEMLERQGLSEAERLHEMLTWMRQNATLSEYEEMEILAKAEAEGKDGEAELKRELQRKWDQFDRRAGGSCCKAIREKATPEFLEKLKKGDPVALEEARLLVNAVSKANFKLLVKNVILVVIAILGILAFIGSLVMSGPLAPVLFAISAVLWLLVDSKRVNEKSSELLWKIRNSIWTESGDRLKGRACSILPQPNLSTTSAPKRDYLPRRSTPMVEMSARSRSSSLTGPGHRLDPKRFSRSSPTSKRRATLRHRSAASW